MNLSKFYLKHLLELFLIVNLIFFSFDALSISIDDQQSIPQSVEIAKKKNPGDLRYAAFYKNQERLIAYLSNEPRMIDFMYRPTFLDMTKQEKDYYSPQNWGVAIVGDSIDHIIPMIKGGYFVFLIYHKQNKKARNSYSIRLRKKTFLESAGCSDIATTPSHIKTSLDPSMRLDNYKKK